MTTSKFEILNFRKFIFFVVHSKKCPEDGQRVRSIEFVQRWAMVSVVQFVSENFLLCGPWRERDVRFLVLSLFHDRFLCYFDVDV